MGAAGQGAGNCQQKRQNDTRPKGSQDMPYMFRAASEYSHRPVDGMGAKRSADDDLADSRNQAAAKLAWTMAKTRKEEREAANEIFESEVDALLRYDT